MEQFCGVFLITLNCCCTVNNVLILGGLFLQDFKPNLRWCAPGGSWRVFSDSNPRIIHHAPLWGSHIYCTLTLLPLHLTVALTNPCGFKGIKMWNVRIIYLVAKAWKTSKSASDPMAAISQESGLMLIDREAFTGERVEKHMDGGEGDVHRAPGGWRRRRTWECWQEVATGAVKHTLSSQHVQANPTWTRLNKVQLHMATLWGTIEP